jgi:hypothetical protein
MSGSMSRWVAALAVAVAVLACAASAAGETAGPQWRIMAVSTPTNFKPGEANVGPDVNSIVVTAVNVGGASTNGSTVTVSDALPEGLVATGAFGVNTYHVPEANTVEEQNDSLACKFSSAAVSCITPEPVDPGDTLIVTIPVEVESSLPVASCEVPAMAVGCLLNSASVSGGGALGASVNDPVTISSVPAPHGVAQGGSLAVTSSSQAGGHPNLTQAFFLNTVADPRFQSFPSAPSSPTKDVRFSLPRGLLGTTVGVARCTMAEVENAGNCPRDTMVGTATLIVLATPPGRLTFTVPVYNIAPAPGEPLAFAFDALFFPVRIDASVLSDGEYNARVTVGDITTGAAFYMSSVTIWGDPAEHDGPGRDSAARGGSGFPPVSFGGPGVEEASGSFPTANEKRVPLLTNPSQCSESLRGVLEVDSWEAPGVFGGPGTADALLGTPTGCGELSFTPGVSMVPDTLEAGAPAGYQFSLTLPQNTEPDGLATPYVKRTSVTLPLGTVISPSAADGLGVCTNEEFYGPAGERGQAQPAAKANCPRDSQVGTVRVKSPAIEEQLTGQVYLGSPECTGLDGTCTPEDAALGRMVHLYLQFVSEGEGGIVVKLEGKGYINQQTGQITTVFEDTPELPFSELKLTLQGGERATLANPRSCGQVQTTAELTPWSTPFTPDATPVSVFDINENCFGSRFSPSFSSGTTSNQAGGYSPFTLSMGRGDDEEFLNGVQITMPPGLLGALSNVKLCEEPQAAQGTCGPESLIGEVTVETGPGADPFLVKGGKVYITSSYRGAPYGLSIVVPAKAGPFVLSGTTGVGTVVVRSAISVNPANAQLTVTSDPLPTELDGIPLQLRLVNVTVGTGGNFTFNPTSCNKMSITGTETSTQAVSASESSSFQVTNCEALKFKPQFTVSTSGQTSRADGANLDARLVYPNTGQGTQADIAKVKVELPRQLPSRLPTLQKACTAAVFDANPANCPAPSIIGVAKVSTPVLPVQLNGPVYFVSHGGEAFPSLTIVLQGDGVRVDLTGATYISKAGVTSTTFNTVPDVPFSSFELYLPEGKYSALTALGNLCKSSPVMPTLFVAQNGTEIHQNTKIAVTGCPHTRKAAKASRGKAKKASRDRSKKASDARRSSHGKGGRS